jgi:hypothetical protein
MPLIKAPISPEFPAVNNEERYYLPRASAIITPTPTRYTIAYLPYFIRKNTQNLILCVEQTGSGTQSIDVGVYNGSNGISSAPRIYSGTINCTGIGIFTISTNLAFNTGYYIVAGMATSATPLIMRGFTITAVLNDFSRPNTEATISTNYNFTQTGLTSLPSNIGTITQSSLNTGANVFLRY